MVALRAGPGAWVPFERAGDGERTGLSILGKLSSKALLYRCAVSRAGCYGRVTAVADRGLLGAVHALVRSMWWAREELTSDFFRVRSNEPSTGLFIG